MTIPGGGQDIAELLRQHGKEAIFRAAEAGGLRVVQGSIQCPFQGCQDQGKDRRANVRVFAAEGGKHKLKCHRCSESGDLLDLLERLNQWTRAEAIAHLRGSSAPAPRPHLRVVAPPAVDPDKLSPAEVRRAWDALAKDDELGRTYLESRNLSDSPFFRYATEAVADSRVKMHAKHGRRVAMLMSDVVGNAKGIQFRLVRSAGAKEAKQMSLKGSTSSGAFFGQPELIEAASLVLVAEGMADTAALQLWAGDAGVTVGAGGKDQLHHLADSLKAAGIAVDGKVFALFPQNDRPRNLSRREFVRLSQLLMAEGAHVVLCATPDEWKDLAEWHKGMPGIAWPPAELARIAERDAGDEFELQLVRPEGGAVSVPVEFRTNRYAQDFTTLCSLLDDPVHREGIMGRGNFSTSEMTGEALFNGKPLGKVDIAAIRYGLEQQGRSLDGKSLKFTVPDITEAIMLLGSRKRVHPIADFLNGLKWDARSRRDGLCNALGQTDPLACHLLWKWLISAVARPLRPGCKVDTVLVLIGPEEIGKSDFFHIIGGQWFSDAKVNIDDDNGKRIMRRSWIVEWAELDAMRRARDQESIKAFLSQQTDVYRPLWSEALVEAPRHSLICGTTNNVEFLTDANGNRRFWPIVVSRVDADWLRANREQLLAEAVVAFRAGEQWWLEEEYRPLLAKLHQRHEAHDDWEQLIADWAPIRNNILSEVTGARLLGSEVINKPVGQWTHLDRIRVGKIMKRLGWVPGTQRIGGKAQPVFRRKEGEE